MKSEKRFIGVLVVSFAFLASCAGESAFVKDRPGNLQPAKSRVQTADPAPDKETVVREEDALYRLSPTPYGFVKQRVEPAEITPEAPPPPQIKEEPPRVIVLEPSPGPEATGTAQRSEVRPLGGAQALVEREATPEEGSEIVLNFDDADIYEVIRMMAELLKINYIVDPAVRGKVTIHTSGKLSTADLFPVFYQVLEANGLTAVREGSLYKIVPAKEAPRLPMVSRIGRDAEGISAGDKIIIQIIPLQYISVAEMTKLLTPFVSAQGVILAQEASNTMVVVDKGINILKVLRLVDAFDVDIFAKVHHRFFPLAFMNAAEMIKVLETLFTTKGAGSGDLKFVGIDRLNMVLGISSTPGIFQRVEVLVKQLDIPGDVSDPRIYVYYVKNGAAKELGDVLNQVFSKEGTAGKSKEKEPQKRQPYPARSPEEPQPTDKPPAMGNPFAMETTAPGGVAESGGGAGTLQSLSGTLRSEVRIIPDEVRNALIIQAIPTDYRVIESTLDRIDVLPRQVLIEVTIAEISLDSALQLGVEWNYVKGPGSLSTSLLSAKAGVSGLQYVVGQTARWSAALSALASENKLNVLSSPSILASDNKEATINISTEIPVASSQYTYTTGSEPLLQTTIQYRNTGLILSVTPHINDRGLVTMLVKQEVSDQAQNVLVGGSSYPSFFKRSVDTTLTVQHGQTIVIGGLMKETKSDNHSGVPVLNRVPVLKWVFGKQDTSRTKSELIILITPHVITSLEDVDAVTQEFKRKGIHLFE
jgi:general secretion pathway protein D